MHIFLWGFLTSKSNKLFKENSQKYKQYMKNQGWDEDPEVSITKFNSNFGTYSYFILIEASIINSELIERDISNKQIFAFISSIKSMVSSWDVEVFGKNNYGLKQN